MGLTMNELIQYLKDALGTDPEVKKLKVEKLNALPVYMINMYEFKLINLYRKDIMLVFVNNDYTTERLRKHLGIIRNTFNIITVAIIGNVEAYNRLRLIEKKVQFIIPGKQMYLPDLLIDLKEYGTKPMETPLVMQPAAQKLLLYHLQVETLENINFKEIAGRLGYSSAMTITRAAYYLHNTGLCAIKGTKDKFLHFNMNKKELWEKAEPHMFSPIKKKVYFSGWINEDDIYKANNSALAYYTNLNDDAIDYYATGPGRTIRFASPNLKKTGLLEGNICIEEWKYSPYKLTKTEYVDPLSLYLCFRNNPDERVELALEQIINNMKW